MHKNIKNRRIRLFAVGGAVGAVVFLALFGPALFPSWDAFCRGGFVEKDILQHYAGWLFLRQSPVQFPLCFTERINWPSGISVAYTDSIPLFAAFFRFFSALLPDTFQYFGIFSLLCYVLQAGFAALLLGEWMPGILRPVMGSLLFACSPVMIERTLHHTALAAHFFILAALYYYVRSRHEERFCYWPLWALNALSITIHPYFLPMVFAVTLAMLAEYAVRHREWKKPLAFLLSDLAAAVGLGWCFGLLGSGGTDGSEMLYGYFSMNLNALWNPTSLSTVWSRFLPVQNQIRGNYDAFNYLGLGILLGCAAGALCLLRRPKRLLLLLKQHWCLTLVCACLTAFAVTNQVTANGAALLTLPLPNKLLALCSVFRSSGRLFWPVYYLLFLLALWALSQLFAGRRAALLLGALVCVQLADLSPALAARHAETYQYREEFATQLTSPFWPQAAGRYGHICSLDADAPQQDALHLALWAADNGMTTNDLFAARYDAAGQAAQQQTALALLQSGQPAEDTLYITHSEAVFLSVAESIPDSAWCGAVDDSWYVIAPGMQGFAADGCVPYGDSYPLRIADYSDDNWQGGVLSWDGCTVLLYDSPLARTRLQNAAALQANGEAYPIVQISDKDAGWLMVTLDTADASALRGQPLTVIAAEPEA